MAGTEPAEVDLAALAAGEKRAWDGFVMSHGGIIRGAVLRTFRRFGAADRDAEDVVQDVFVRLANREFRLIRSFDPSRSKLSTWLSVVSHSAAVDALRKRRPAAPLDDSPEIAAPPERDLHAPVELPEGVLTDSQVAVLRLLFDRDMDVPEAARLLRVTEQTVRSTKHKAIERLRQWHAAQNGGG